MASTWCDVQTTWCAWLKQNPTWCCQVGGFCFPISGKSFARISSVKIPKHSEAACGGGMRRSVWYSLHIFALSYILLLPSCSSSCSSNIILPILCPHGHPCHHWILFWRAAQHPRVIIALEPQFYRRIGNPPTGPSQIKTMPMLWHLVASLPSPMLSVPPLAFLDTSFS